MPLHGSGRIVGCSLAVGVALAAAGALAQSAGAKAVAARQANFKQLGAAFKTINDELKKGSPNMALIKSSADKMSALAVDQPTWFPKGSGPEAGVKTGAKPEIWSDAAGFAAAMTKLRGETAKLSAVAAGGDAKAVAAQVQATGGACKGCHDKFRVKQS